MLSRIQNSWTAYRLELWLIISVFFSYAYFYNGAAWNHNSRLDAIYAFVEPGSPDYRSFRIDRFITNPEKGENTGDWARFGDHYYSNKAPGIALIGIPWYWLLFHAQRLLAMDPAGDGIALLNAYLLHLLVSVIPVAVSAAFFYRLACLCAGGRREVGLAGTVVLYWGTLMFPYSTQTWGHGTAAGILIVSLYFSLRTGWRSAATSGFFAGTAVLTEYSAILAVVVATVGLCRSQARCRVVPFLLGGVPPLIVFALYHKACFGAFITVANLYNNPYYLNDPSGMASGLVDGIQWHVIWGLTFSPYRGIFAYMPILVLSLVGLWFLRRHSQRNLLAGCVAVMLLVFAMNLFFNGWHGGACFGPRYQIVALPCYVLCMLAIPWRRWFVPVGAILFAISWTNMLLCAAISPLVPQNVANPVLAYYRGLLRMLSDSGDFLHPWNLPIRLQTEITPTVRAYSAFDWGELLGLRGVGSLLLWSVAFCGMVGYLLYLSRRVPTSNRAD